ncbi:PREDICTED: uncharacterized protein C1orf21 homolog isoform X1 [Capra hircus]|uniref:uncharacterized protein C1orf21 homolog isoform X1 n=1 Tax=Capra hircus TaxID=9925 RepID=UPI0008472205|nr:PREDICTED: uncharacterized protein C1orf21 homolog isoform X1 [Capra hircus]
MPGLAFPCFQQAQPLVWLGSPAELGRPGLRAVQRLLPGHRPGVRPRTQLSRRGLPSSGGVRAHTHTHARPRPRFLSAALAVAQSPSLPPGCAAPAGPSRGRGGGQDARGSRARGGAGAGGVSGCPRPSSAPILTNSARRWIFPVSKEKKHVPVSVEMICSSARLKLTE